MGKTPAAIVAARLSGAESIVVLTRAIVRRQWLEEVRTWYPDLNHKNLIIDSYERVSQRRDLRANIEALNPDVLILDECHRLKNSQAQRTKVVYGHGFRGGLVDYAESVWGLSGTIMPNHIGELWTHLKALFPEYLPPAVKDEDAYLDRYAKTRTIKIHNRYIHKVSGSNPAHIPEMRAILKKVMLRRTWAEIAPDLPPLVVSPVIVERTAADIAPLAALEQQHAAELVAYGKAILAGHVMDRPSKPFSAFMHAAGRAKVAPACELIGEELEENQYPKVIVFAYHLDVLDALLAGLGKHGAVLVNGATSAKNRATSLSVFQNDPSVRVFIGQIDVCSEALDLSAAEDVVFVEQSWIPDTNYQAAMRAQNSMHPRPINVRMLGLADSVDADQARAIAGKTREKAALLTTEEAA